MRLGKLIRGRRAALGMDIAPTARSIQMSPDTWARVEEGASVRPTTYARIESVLGWSAGSILRYLEGGPEPIPERPQRRPEPDVTEDLARAAAGNPKLAKMIADLIAEVRAEYPLPAQQDPPTEQHRSAG